jgi:hypothetical protein
MMLSRRDLMARYGCSAQRLNGLRARSALPLPEPKTVTDGEPYWEFFVVMRWEAEVRRARATFDKKSNNQTSRHGVLLK